MNAFVHEVTTSSAGQKSVSAVMPAAAQPPSQLARYMQSHEPHSLASWVALYWRLHVVGGPHKTMVAKRQDIERFLRFFAGAIGSDAIDDWTPAVSKAFVAMLTSEVSAKTKKPLCATTVNRVMATLRTFTRWVHKERPFLAGLPLAGVKPRPVDAPGWYGLTDRQVVRLKVACEQRQSFCTSKIQQPRLETAVFMVLLMTGMREHELVALDMHQYRDRAFHEVRRKGAKVTKRISLPKEARNALDHYNKGVERRIRAKR